VSTGLVRGVGPALGEVLLGAPRALRPGWSVVVGTDPVELDAYRVLRREVFVDEQGLFDGPRGDTDDTDDDPRTVVLLARTGDGTVLGGVRLAPAGPGADLGWWTGSRLVVRPGARAGAGVGAALVRAACAHAEALGVLRFEAHVQAAHGPLFARLGWERLGALRVHGREHVAVRWPCARFEAQVRATKADLGPLLAGLDLGGPGFVGDDGVAVAGTDVIAACDAIVPSLVERDPEWAGWCAVLVNVNDLAAMGADPVGLLDAIGARDAAFAARVVTGLRAASRAWGVPVLGGHTQLGVPAAL
jgi:putative N-acetyltransferase (TIGR04045 family)